MSQHLSKSQYEQQVASSRDGRMAWWREARFGLFIHYGLYAQLGRNEWETPLENIPQAEYEKLAATFSPRKGAPREWAALAKRAGMKYMVLTTRHHEGFSLWDSCVNPYNSVNFGPKRDIVREYVEACREFGLGIGFYSSLMDWHHPDGWRCAFDTEARRRFTQYIRALNTELLTQYGKIDILWYDGPFPMETWEGWDSLELNEHMRSLQPDIILNDRSRLPEDFGTPEEHVTASDRDWEACMTFNGISWGYVDGKQAAAYGYNAQRILRMLCTCAAGGGNLLLNIGPAPDGSIPPESAAALEAVGKWLGENGRAAYGRLVKNTPWPQTIFGGNGVSDATFDGKSVFLWNWIWPTAGEMGIGGYMEAPKAVRLLKDGTPVAFEHRGNRIILKDLPPEPPDRHTGVTVIEMEFDSAPRYFYASLYPHMREGRDIVGDAARSSPVP